MTAHQPENHSNWTAPRAQDKPESTTLSGLYRTIEFTATPLPDHAVFACSQLSGRGMILTSSETAWLRSLTAFAPLNDRAAEQNSIVSANDSRSQPSEDRLHRMIASDLLMSFSSILDMVKSGADTGTSSEGIDSLAVVTKNRPKELIRALNSYCKSAVDFDRRPTIVVFDESELASHRQSNLHATLVAKDEFGLPVQYFGSSERSGLAQSLANTGSVPPHVVRFALFGDTMPGLPTIGANRNALALQLPGQRTLSVDDDTVCQPATPLDVDDNAAYWRFVSEKQSLRGPDIVRVYPSRSDVLKAVAVAPHDIIGQHGQLIGRNALALILQFTRQHGFQPKSLDNADLAAFVRRVLRGQGRIRVTLNGLYGDSGHANTNANLIALQDMVDVELRLHSREIVKHVPSITFAPIGHELRTGFIGLDFGGCLPPFPPYGRGEDTIFGAILRLTDGDALACYLPPLLFHSPMADRQLQSQGDLGSRKTGVTIEIASFLLACLSYLEGTCLFTNKEPETSIVTLGRALTSLSQLDDTEIWRIVFPKLCLSLVDRLVVLEAGIRMGRIKDGVHLAKSRSTINEIKTFLDKPESPFAQIADNSRSSTLTLKSARTLLRRYGELLVHWPELLSSARRLADARQAHESPG